jgi:predicted nucleic acid-binding protein
VTRAIADTGPIVAFLDTRDPLRDPHHSWAQETFNRYKLPLITCEAVLSEACFVVGQATGRQNAVMGLVSRGVLAVDFRLAPNFEAVRKLMAKYASVPMSLADACLVRMTELDGRASVITMDSDFRIYRRNGRQTVPVVMPE